MALNGDINKSSHFEDAKLSDVEVAGKLDQHNTMLSGIVRIGRVVEKRQTGDPNEPGDIPRVLVQIGGPSEGSYIRNWLPWVTSRAGYDAEWWRPEPDEQVLVLAPSGNLVQGIIVGSLYRGSLTFDSQPDNIPSGIATRDPIPGDAEGAAETDQQIHKRIYQDGTSISYDRSIHELAVELKNSPAAAALLRFAAIMDPQGAAAGTGKATLQIGETSAPSIEIAVDSTSGNGGELKVFSTLKTTLMAGATAPAPALKMVVDATSGSEKITLNAGATSVAINKDGAVDINAGTNDITIVGNVKVTGTLDVN